MKVKGVLYTNRTYSSDSDSLLNNTNHGRIWDVADYVVPPMENGAFFVTTNALITSNQTQGKCAEDPKMLNVKCKEDSDCRRGEPVVNGNGVRTGSCLHVGICEIYAWCPVEIDNTPKESTEALLGQSRRFTVLIKNHIEFPKFNIKRRNIINTQNSTYLKSCIYSGDSENDRLCPIFTLDTIVSEAGQSYDEIALKGGIISIGIHWDCNLDYSVDYCLPEYTFRRIDDDHSLIANGWNFRYANHYNENGVQTRDLFKAYGILFIVKVTGRGRKFNIVPLLLNIGSSLGLLVIATVTCDLVILHLLTKRKYYRDNKFLFVNSPHVQFEDSISDDQQIIS